MIWNYRLRWPACAAIAIVVLSATRLAAQDSLPNPLAEGVRPFLRAFSGQLEQFELTGTIQVQVDGEPQKVSVRVARIDDESFDLELTHKDYAVSIRRRNEASAFALPKHSVVYLGRGKIESADCLKPRGIQARLVGGDSKVAGYVQLLQPLDASALAFTLSSIGVRRDVNEGGWKVGKVSFEFPKNGSINANVDGTNVRLSIKQAASKVAAFDDWPGLRAVRIDRAELETQLSRGVRRALEVLAPGPQLSNPTRKGRRVDHGELRWIGGQRVALLAGTPEQVGRAHGQLFQVEARRCIDSVLYAFGTVQTIRTGRWFRHDLEAAYARLAPHIPERHKRETNAMAKALGISPQLAQALNVFPELFHCSGFAVFGKATKDGKLYHGRVLDYMTAIGLQDAATTFVVKIDGKIPFANVGYAGFTGSVTGMNARAISLGEMGGRGEGKWDGAPMATLMRRALEECATLDEVIALWKSSPRTCEYYYVFADGKTNRAVGVAAVPESIEFVHPGQSHPRLGKGIEDVIVLSAGSRLEKLRQRIQTRYGELDAELGQWLMSKPVAMQSNLHNVLFVPADGVMYVANADHKNPAANRPYVRLDLIQLLKSMPASDVGSPHSESANRAEK
jgi:hypothetical protein